MSLRTEWWSGLLTYSSKWQRKISWRWKIFFQVENREEINHNQMKKINKNNLNHYNQGWNLSNIIVIIKNML